MIDTLPLYLFISRIRELTRAFAEKLGSEFEFFDQELDGFCPIEAVRHWRNPLMDLVMAFDQMCEAPDHEVNEPALAKLIQDRNRIAGIRIYFESAVLALIRSDRPLEALTNAVDRLTAAGCALRAWQMEQFPGLSIEQIAAAEELGVSREIPCIESLKQNAVQSIHQACEEGSVVELCVATRRLFLVTRIVIAATPEYFLEGSADFETLTEMSLHRKALARARELEVQYGPSDLASLCIKSIKDRTQWLETLTPQSLIRSVTATHSRTERSQFSTGRQVR